jgi:3-oxoacyl-[acyl-carrier protein] reductase
MDLQLTGKRAAVAGASSGLGYATAVALADEGVRVAICGRHADRVAAAAEHLGEDAVGLVADVGSAEGGRQFVEDATEALGGLDILVTNAGGPRPGTFESTPLEAYPEALQLNLLSVVGMCTAAVPRLREQGWGRIVAITSVAVRQPIPNLILSNTARTGATGFLKTLALEVAKDGITVNSVLPGLHDTDRLRQLHGGQVDEDVTAGIPAGTVGSPADFGAVVAFLCSPHARFITGAALPVDGGAYRGLL